MKEILEAKIDTDLFKAMDAHVNDELKGKTIEDIEAKAKEYQDENDKAKEANGQNGQNGQNKNGSDASSSSTDLNSALNNMSKEDLIKAINNTLKDDKGPLTTIFDNSV